MNLLENAVQVGPFRGDQKAYDAFWYWINERHQIHLKRQAGDKWPWTTDKVLQEYRFCNVFRELDTVTIAFRKMLREPFANSPNLWFAYCLARQINHPETVQEIVEHTLFPFDWHPNTVYDVMRARQARGEKMYTGAYMLRGDIQNGQEDNNKPKYTVFKVLDPVWQFVAKRREHTDNWTPETGIQTIEGWTTFLESFSGWGGFLAYEVATDLRHSRYLSAAPDIMTWANPGPGAKRGLNRIFGRPLNQSLSRDKALTEMRWLLHVSRHRLEDHVPALEMRDIEHSLCETDKYLRVLNGEGRPRAKYRPQ